ncbi:hypothetical protein D3C81_1506300 [compost metagenome]
MICPNGTECTKPLPSRRRKVRMVRPSTVPACPESSTTQSPMDRVSSMMMNSPVITSCTSCWEPKPIARPMTPAPARNGATLMPRLAMVVIAQITTRMILIALRSSGRMVFTRVLGWRAERLLVGGFRAS